MNEHLKTDINQTIQEKILYSWLTILTYLLVLLINVLHLLTKFCLTIILSKILCAEIKFEHK